MSKIAVAVMVGAGCLFDSSCSSDVARQFDPATAAFCDASGAYTADYKERSGDCGALPEEVVFIGDDTMQTDSGDAGDKCTGTVMRSANRCSALIETTCDVHDLSGKFVRTQLIRGKTTVTSADGRMLTGVYDVSLSNASASCRSTYDVTFSKL